MLARPVVKFHSKVWGLFFIMKNSGEIEKIKDRKSYSKISQKRAYRWTFWYSLFTPLSPLKSCFKLGKFFSSFFLMAWNGRSSVSASSIKASIFLSLPRYTVYLRSDCSIPSWLWTTLALSAVIYSTSPGAFEVLTLILAEQSKPPVFLELYSQIYVQLVLKGSY